MSSLHSGASIRKGRSVGERRPDPIDIIVGRNIRIHRLNKGQTQSELASQIGVTFQQLEKYEQGTTRVGGGRLFKIANALDLPISIFFEEGPQTPAFAKHSALELLADRHALRLLKSFSEIEKPELRRSLVALVERLASLK